MRSSIPASGIDPVAITTAAAVDEIDVPRLGLGARVLTAIRRNPTIFAGGLLLLILIVLAIAAPWITGDPFKQTPANRLRPPSEKFRRKLRCSLFAWVVRSSPEKGQRSSLASSLRRK